MAHDSGLADKAAKIVREHNQLLERTDRLIERVRKAAKTEMPSRSIEVDFRQLAKQLHLHEKAESDLLERSFGMHVE